MFKRIYIETTNVCNLSCAFCPGTRREKRFMTEKELEEILLRLRGHTRHLYFHLMGEPLLHPQLPEFIQMADEHGFLSMITTNGTLLSSRGDGLLASRGLHRVNISLQAYEANSGMGALEKYIAGVAGFAKKCGERGVICSMRLWNGGGAESLNDEVTRLLAEHFPGRWRKGQMNETLDRNVFLERGERFDWPDMTAEELGGGTFCRGLRDHIGILCDGTVVPCCLDHEGDAALGNIFESELEDIVSSERARNIYDGFTGRQAREELCRKCGYARRF